MTKRVKGRSRRRAYEAGYRAGQRYAVRKLNHDLSVEKVERVVPKETFPTDSRVYKWDGFVEAMNLIIQSRRG